MSWTSISIYLDIYVHVLSLSLSILCVSSLLLFLLYIIVIRTIASILTVISFIAVMIVIILIINIIVIIIIILLIVSYMTRVNKNTRVLNHWPQLWRNNPFKEQQAFFIGKAFFRGSKLEPKRPRWDEDYQCWPKGWSYHCCVVNASCMQVFQLKDEACDMCFEFIAFHSVNGEKLRNFGKITCF